MRAPRGRAPARRLALLAGLALAVALGRWSGLEPLVAHLGPLRLFRFPVKAFFTVHLALALLAGLGLQALAEGRRVLTLATLALVAGALLAAAPLLPQLAPASLAAFAAAFYPPGYAPQLRTALLGRVLQDAATGGLVALALGAVALLAARGRLAGTRAAWLALALAAADLLRTGAGLNPMAPASAFEPSPELAARLPELREGRVFTCPVDASPAYLAGRASRGRDHELWSFAVLRETLSPACNVPLGVETALSPDLTMLVPVERLLPDAANSCRELDALVPRLRAAGVTTVLSLDALEHADLEPEFELQPARLRPVEVHAYRVRDPLPRLALVGPGGISGVARRTDRLELTAEAEGATTLLVREAWAPAWRAQVDGVAVEMPRARHREIPLSAGRHRVQLAYRPPHLAAALVASGLALAALGWLGWAGRRAG